MVKPPTTPRTTTTMPMIANMNASYPVSARQRCFDSETLPLCDSKPYAGNFRTAGGGAVDFVWARMYIAFCVEFPRTVRFYGFAASAGARPRFRVADTGCRCPAPFPSCPATRLCQANFQPWFIGSLRRLPFPNCRSGSCRRDGAAPGRSARAAGRGGQRAAAAAASEARNWRVWAAHANVRFWTLTELAAECARPVLRARGLRSCATCCAIR